MNFFDTQNIVFTVLDYPVSYVELIATLFGLFAVWFAARENILTWPMSLVNVTCFFIIFYQVQLYSDMLLQIYFFSISIYGWVVWRKQKGEKKPISLLNKRQRIIWIIVLLISTAILGSFMSRIHIIFSDIFSKPAAFPFVDAFTTSASIVAQFLLARRVLENWVLWIIVDIISVAVYSIKGIQLISLEFLVFLIIATMGLIGWLKLIKVNKDPMKNHKIEII